MRSHEVHAYVDQPEGSQPPGVASRKANIHAPTAVSDQEATEDIKDRDKYADASADLGKGRGGGEGSSSVNSDAGASIFRDGRLVVSFGYDTAEIPGKTFDALNRLAVLLGEREDMEIVVRGYTDALGPPPYNKVLSELRASAVEEYLVSRGVSPLRIEAIGMGDENPVEPNTTPAGRQANRRAEIELVSAKSQ
jgi:outer membrane protein OmpA-like peptidoglycan-associated protein